MSSLLRQALCLLSAALIVTAGAVALSTPAVAASPVYVDGPGMGVDETGCGNGPGHACATIQYAIDNQAVAGDTVLVEPGTYTGAVSITKPLTLHGVSGAVIDGSTQDLTTVGDHGVVTVGAAGGAVTVSGFTITGHAADGTQIGVLGVGNTGTTTITNNDISATSRGVDLQDEGPATVSGNAIHDLDDTAEPLVGIAVSTDTDTADQTVAANTFTLSASTNGSAIDLTTAGAGNTLGVTLGGNTGTVAAPTRTVHEDANGGSITITPTATTNSITPTPAPMFNLAFPTSVTTLEAPVTVAATATHLDSVSDLTNAQFDIAITGPTANAGGHLDLESGGSRIALSGTANDDGITGEFPGTTTFPKDFDLSADGAVAGTLSITITLDELTADGQALNTVASDPNSPGATDSLTIVANSAPPAAPRSAPVAVGHSVQITLVPATDVDGDAITHKVPSAHNPGAPGHGTASVNGHVVTYTPGAGYTGEDSFVYTATDSKGLESTGTVTITIAKASSAVSSTVTYSPLQPTSADTPKATFTVTSDGVVNGGKVTVKTGSSTRTGTVSGGKATVTLLAHYTGGNHTISVSFGGTSTTTNTSAKSFTFFVAKVASSLSFSTSPAQLTTKSKGKAIVQVSASGATVDGARVTIKSGTTTVGTGTVSGGKATISLPTLTLGQHNWTVSYPGTSTSTASSKAVVVRVALG